MPRIRCHYEGCTHLEGSYCSADTIQLDPEMGCLMFTQESEDVPDEEEWDEEFFEEDEDEEWDLDEDLDDLDLDDEDEDW